MTYNCPLCLRFRFNAELENHARDDHAPHEVAESIEHITSYHDERPRPRFVTPSM